MPTQEAASKQGHKPVPPGPWHVAAMSEMSQGTRGLLDLSLVSRDAQKARHLSSEKDNGVHERDGQCCQHGAAMGHAGWAGAWAARGTKLRWAELDHRQGRVSTDPLPPPRTQKQTPAPGP